jgi:plastocyanin/uncharacterized membrane protein YozB (DUF420 family)
MTLFYGINAPWAANVNLAVQIAMGLALLAGMMLARRKLFRAHGICQATIVILNLVPIFYYMLPVFRRGVLPGVPTKLNDAYYATSTAHAAFGTVAEILGLYIILVAGTKLLPQALRFKKWKRWMRAELIIWWIVIGFGISTYFVWYGADEKAGSDNNIATAAQPQSANSPKPSAPEPQATPQTVTVDIGNYSFTPKELKIEAGTTVVWLNNTGRHTVAADDGSFESSVMSPGEKFSHTFESAGQIPYYCSLHGAAGGKDMAGVITVTRRGKP